jgi:hypothetical protein
MATLREKVANEAEAKPLPASFDIDSTVRRLVNEAIRSCPNKSRAQIAEEMSYLLGQRVTEPMLDSYTADSKKENRFPVAFAAAFCHATGDGRVLEAIAQKVGLVVVHQEEMQLIRLGKLALECESASEEFSGLKKQLLGRKR